MGIILDNEETQKFVFIAGCFKDLPFSALHSALIAHPFPALEGVCMDRECLFNRRPQQICLDMKCSVAGGLWLRKSGFRMEWPTTWGPYCRTIFSHSDKEYPVSEATGHLPVQWGKEGHQEITKTRFFKGMAREDAATCLLWLWLHGWIQQAAWADPWSGFDVGFFLLSVHFYWIILSTRCVPSQTQAFFSPSKPPFHLSLVWPESGQQS